MGVNPSNPLLFINMPFLKKTKNKNVLVLFSGGIDSTACIKFYLNLNYEIKALYIDYGQPSKNREYKAAKKISSIYKIKFKKIAIKNFDKRFIGKIIGRNAMLLNIGLLDFDFNRGIIAIGIHSGTDYEDCSSVFINEMQNLFDIYTSGKIQIGTPFINFSKEDIIKYCIENSIDLKHTYSCELGKKQPCGKCLSCNFIKENSVYKKSNNKNK